MATYDILRKQASYSEYIADHIDVLICKRVYVLARAIIFAD